MALEEGMSLGSNYNSASLRNRMGQSQGSDSNSNVGSFERKSVESTRNTASGLSSGLNTEASPLTASFIKNDSSSPTPTDSPASTHLQIFEEHNESTHLIPHVPSSPSSKGHIYQTFDRQNLSESHSSPHVEHYHVDSLLAYTKKNLTRENIIEQGIKQPLSLVPSVILGVLLNVLDGLSYGMILFPIGLPMFSHLGPAGLSMFYMSCIISQLVYSLGGSAFKAGIGSEMIEVVPFFHSMTFAIMDRIGAENKDAIIATTILSFALSSVVTGLVFFLLGYAHLGSLVGFFPRHILIGCVGGVGFFLVVTGIEVSSRMTTSLEYTFPVFKYLFFNTDILLKWSIPLCLACFLMFLERKIHNSLLVPIYFISLFFIFHIAVEVIPGWSLSLARDNGWVFPSVESNEPWWYFYTLYDFKKVNYVALLDTIPAMFALTFFGLLHVPINVPALAVSIGEDDIDVDRELIAHGMSNALSGLCGSIQNYLVYTNSVLFIKSGANSRLAGVMLALATALVMFSGPGVIGYIPVMVVGALIFLLGLELLAEALVDTWGRVRKWEYLTIVVIVVTMGTFDFVFGIIMGIILACVTFVFEASQTSIVKATYTGEAARSTVRRHFAQQQFLSQVGKQIYVMKLSGYVFFGTIVSLEKQVRELMDEATFDREPIRFMVLDISAVTDIDYSAAEAFARMKRLLDLKRVTLILAGASENGKNIQGLRAVQLIDPLSLSDSAASEEDTDDSVHIRVFPDLNTGLEFCENEFLRTYYRQRDALQKRNNNNYNRMAIPSGSVSGPGRKASLSTFYGASPRAAVLHQAVSQNARKEVQTTSKWQHFKPPMPVMMQVFQNVSDRNEDFWFKVAPFFKKVQLEAGTVLYHSETVATGFYLVESGMLRADYDLAQGKLYESILAGTTCGELPFFSQTTRTATVRAEKNSVVWKLDRESWIKLQQMKPNGAEISVELLEVALKLTVERFTSITAYVMMSAS